MSRPQAVVFIEDDPQFRLTMTAYPEDSGCLVFEAGDGWEGLEEQT